VSAADLGLLRLVVPRGGLVPDLLYPADLDPTITACGQLAGLAAMPLADYTAELMPMWAPAPIPAPLAGEQGRAGLIEALRRYAERTLGPAWPNIRAAIDAEVAHRGGQALERGLGGLFGDLHPELRLDGSVLTVAKSHHSCPRTTRSSIVLVPSVFAWPRLVVVDRSPATVQLHYPVRHVGRDIHPVEPAEDALAALMGGTRARILRELTVPRSTTQLARRLALSPGGTSAHLSTLRRNGLVTATRDGRQVLYRCTALGTSIIAAGGGSRQAQ
jgi:DNA-binding transcriptional ArsR family regulator